jgi:hypothetical protein
LVKHYGIITTEKRKNKLDEKSRIEGTQIELFSFFFYFYNILHFDEFCRTRYFEFLNSVLHKNLEVYSSFLDFFISNF